jgi:hypothetical protein
MSLLIDDFTSGPCNIDVRAGIFPTQYQAGSMLGGGRLVSLNNAYNIRNQPAHFDVGTSNRLNLTIGAMDYVRLEIGYGWVPDGAPDHGKLVPLGANLHEFGNAIRTTFKGAGGGPYAINFNVLVFAEHGWSQAGENVVTSHTAFSHEFPFGAFGGPGGQDFRSVSCFVFIYQVWDDMAIDSFEFV